MGEHDTYRRLDLRLRITVGDHLALVERARLEPQARPLTVPGRHGAFSVSGVLYRVGHQTMAGAFKADGASHLIGGGQTGDVEIIRAVSESAQEVHHLFRMVSRSQ